MTYETPGDGSNYPGFGNSYFKPDKRFNAGIPYPIHDGAGHEIVASRIR